jgi:hypothetical protein
VVSADVAAAVEGNHLHFWDSAVTA